MKRIIMLSFAVLLFAGINAKAQTPTTPTTPKPNALKWATENIDMGKIPQGTPASATFSFTNTSAAPVALKTVQPGCGCTTSDYTKEPVAPGKTGYVKATYNAMAMGAFNKSVTVTTDSGEMTVLIIHGEVIAKPTTPAKSN